MARFAPGNRAAVGRRPQSTFYTKLREAAAPEWDGIIRTVIELAKAGDMSAAQFLANRLAPAPKAVAPVIEIDVDGDLSAAERVRAIVGAAMEGRISPDQAKTLVDVIATETQLTQLGEIEGRLSALESKRG